MEYILTVDPFGVALYNRYYNDVDIRTGMEVTQSEYECCHGEILHTGEVLPIAMVSDMYVDEYPPVSDFIGNLDYSCVLDGHMALLTLVDTKWIISDIEKVRLGIFGATD
jgi:hypothetical protein